MQGLYEALNDIEGNSVVETTDLAEYLCSQKLHNCLTPKTRKFTF